MLKKIGLALCIAVLLGSIAIPYYMKKSAADAEKIQEEVVEEVQISLFDFDPNEIRRIEIKDERALILEKQDGSWIDSEYQELRYQSKEISTFIKEISRLESVQVVREVEDFKKYGIEDDSRIITLYDTENQHYTLRLGKAAEDKGQIYLVTDEEESVYIVKGKVIDQLLKTREDLMEKQIRIPLLMTIKDIKITKKDESILHLQKDINQSTNADNTWFLEGFYKETHRLQAEAVDEMIKSLINIEKDRFIGHKENLSDYGLDAPHLTVMLDDTWQISFGNKEGEWVYMMYNQDPYIYQILEEKIKIINNLKPINLICKEVYTIDPLFVNEITITAPDRNTVLEVRRPQEGDEIQELTGFLDGMPLVASQTLELIKLIEDSVVIEAALQNPEIEQKQERKAEIAIVYKLEDSSRTIELIPYDSNFYILRDEGNIEFAVNKQKVMGLLTALNEAMRTTQ